METRDIKWLAIMAVLFIIGMSVAGALSGCATAIKYCARNMDHCR